MGASNTRWRGLDCFAGKKAAGHFFSRKPCGRLAGGKSCIPSCGPKLPFALPAWMLNRYSVKAFNTAYYKTSRACSQARHASVVPYTIRFFIHSTRSAVEPALRQAGVSAIPVRNSGNGNLAALEELLDRIARSGMGSFLGRAEAIRHRSGGRNAVIPASRAHSLRLILRCAASALLELLQSLDDDRPAKRRSALPRQGRSHESRNV
jgi:hypothetical protein